VGIVTLAVAGMWAFAEERTERRLNTEAIRMMDHDWDVWRKQVDEQLERLITLHHELNTTIQAHLARYDGAVRRRNGDGH